MKSLILHMICLIASMNFTQVYASIGDTIFLPNGEFVTTDSVRGTDGKVAAVHFLLNGQQRVWSEEFFRRGNGSLKETKRYVVNQEGKRISEQAIMIQQFGKNSMLKEERGFTFPSGIDSVSRQYFSNGKLFEEIFFFEGGRIHTNSFRENGTWTCNCEFVKGKMHGLNLIYYPNGQLKMAMKYEMDRPWEVISMHDKNGNQLQAGDLKDGTGKLLLYDEEGNRVREDTYVHGIRMKMEKNQ